MRSPRAPRLAAAIAACLLALSCLPAGALATEDVVQATTSTSLSVGTTADEATASSDTAADEAQGVSADEADATSAESADDATTADAPSDTTPADDAADEQADADEPVVTPIVVSVRIVGEDGEWAFVPAVSVVPGASAWDATKLALKATDLTYRAGTASARDVLTSVTRPSDGLTCAQDSTTGSGWHLYLNEERYQGSASTLTLAEGDELAWRYEVGMVTVSVSVVGPGGTGTSYWIAPTTVQVAANKSAWDASYAVFEQNGYGEGRLLSYSTGADGSVTLDALAALGENGITGESWQVFVNGSVPEQDVAHVLLRAGDSICWYYAGRGTQELPTFAAKTGAASQSPVASVRIEGSVSQAWTEPTTAQTDLATVLGTASGLAVTGQGTPSLVSVSAGSALASPVAQVASGRSWQQSLSHMLEGKLRTGVGGRALLSTDGSLYYLDNMGSMVKLELQ